MAVILRGARLRRAVVNSVAVLLLAGTGTTNGPVTAAAQGEIARRVLIQIKVGVDTGERVFYEVYA